jgi:hypothetical protein
VKDMAEVCRKMSNKQEKNIELINAKYEVKKWAKVLRILGLQFDLEKDGDLKCSGIYLRTDKGFMAITLDYAQEMYKTSLKLYDSMKSRDYENLELFV